MKYLYRPLSDFAEGEGLEPSRRINRPKRLAISPLHHLGYPSVNKKNKLSEYQVLVMRESLVSQLVIHEFIRNSDDCQALLHRFNLTSFKMRSLFHPQITVLWTTKVFVLRSIPNVASFLGFLFKKTNNLKPLHA